MMPSLSTTCSSFRRLRRSVACIAACSIIVAACGSDDGEDVDGVAPSTVVDASTTTEPGERATTVPIEPPETLRSTESSDDGELTLTVVSNAAEIWSMTNREVCSPVEPAVALFEAIVDGDGAEEIEAMRAFFERTDEDDDPAATTTSSSTTSSSTTSSSTTSSSTTTSTATSTTGGATTTTTVEQGRTRTLDFAVDDDGIWRVVVGPFRATNRNDRPLDVTVIARTAAGDEIETELELTVLAPVPCGDGERPSRGGSDLDPVELTVGTSPSDGVIVGAEVADCAGRPTTLQVQVEARGAVVALAADVTLPDGSTSSRSADVRGGQRTSFSFGPFPSPPAGVERSATVVVSATDVFGTTVERTATGRLVRPEPCDEDTEEAAGVTTTVIPSTTVAGESPADVFSLSLDPSSPVVWATGSGLCAAGATTFSVEVVAPEDATAVTVQGRTADGVTHGSSGVTSSVSSSVAGTLWRATMGPFPAWPTMPDSSTISVRVSVSNGRTTRTAEANATLRRPEPCGGGATTAPPTTAPPTTAPPTTAAPTTAAPTTAAPAPPQITNAQANPNPVACGAPVTIGAQTTGPVTQVGASLGGGRQPLSGSGGNWSRQFTAPATRQQVTVTVRADGPGGTDQRSFTLNVDC